MPDLVIDDNPPTPESNTSTVGRGSEGVAARQGVFRPAVW